MLYTKITSGEIDVVNACPSSEEPTQIQIEKKIIEKK